MSCPPQLSVYKKLTLFAQEREYRQRTLENQRRCIEERSTQLSAISNLSALLGGFAIVCMVEINLPEYVPPPILISFGGISGENNHPFCALNASASPRIPLDSSALAVVLMFM